MRKTDVLFKQTVVRVGPDQMRGVERLIDDGYHGLAEKQAVSKLILYVKGLEKRLNIDIPNPDNLPLRADAIKITNGGISYYAPRASAA